MSIKVHNPGFATTIQDLGRFGCAHLGVSPAGAADPLSFRIANLLAGNDENTPALEMTLEGVTLEFEEAATATVAGAPCAMDIDGIAVVNERVIHVRPGSVLRCGRISGGARAYLAIAGGFEVPPVLGSAATDLNAGFGGFDGRRLRRGDVLRSANQAARSPRVLRSDATLFAPAMDPTILRVTRSSQHARFDSETMKALLGENFTVGAHWGRTGLRLQGSPLQAHTRESLVSEGVPLGAIQAPPDGQPIILFVEQQTTGGYPIIANVIAADLHRVGQLQAGNRVRFSEVSLPEALRRLREQESWLKQLFESR